MLKELVKLANHLDRIGYKKEADYIDNILKNANVQDLSLYVFSDKYTLSEEEKEELKSKFVDAITNISPTIKEITTEEYKSMTSRQDKVNFLSDKILAYKKDNQYILNSSYKNASLKNSGNTIDEAVADFLYKRLSYLLDTE